MFVEAYLSFMRCALSIYWLPCLQLARAVYDNFCCCHVQVVCLFGLAWSRAANVVPCCAAINHLRPPGFRISKKQQLVLWWSGLRGAMAFALSVEAMKSFPGKTGKVIMTCTFMVILITVLVNGGSTGHLLNWCGLVEGQCVPAGAVGVGFNSSGEVDEPEKASLLLLAGRAVSTGDPHADWRVTVLDGVELTANLQKGHGLKHRESVDNAEQPDSVEHSNQLLQQTDWCSTLSTVDRCDVGVTAVRTAAGTLHVPATAGVQMTLVQPGGSNSSSSSIDAGHQCVAPANQYNGTHQGELWQ